MLLLGSGCCFHLSISRFTASVRSELLTNFFFCCVGLRCLYYIYFSSCISNMHTGFWSFPILNFIKPEHKNASIQAGQRSWSIYIYYALSWSIWHWTSLHFYWSSWVLDVCERIMRMKVQMVRRISRMNQHGENSIENTNISLIFFPSFWQNFKRASLIHENIENSSNLCYWESEKTIYFFSCDRCCFGWFWHHQKSKPLPALLE